MSIKKITLAVLVVTLACLSCERYEDYTIDYQYSAVYFGSQKPLRTVVAREPMQFKFGVAIGGLRANKEGHWATYTIDTTLFSTVPGADQFELLPESYYSLSDESRFEIPKGEVIGDVTLTLDMEDFTSDPRAHLNTYALPVKIMDSSLDSILRGGEGVDSLDYSVIVVKYMSPYAGAYYHKGVEKQLDEQGEVVYESVFRDKDLSKNRVLETSTMAVDTILTNGMGDDRGGALQLAVNDDHSVDIQYEGSTATFESGSGTYDPENTSFYLNYRFSVSGDQYEVVDTLIQRQDPEETLRFEEW